MKISTSTMSDQKTTLLILLFLMSMASKAQKADSLIQRIPMDTARTKMNMDAVYDRPFLSVSKMPVALGGYLEANSYYATEDGVSDGLSFQARRLTMFMSATITKRIKFLSEMEFEDGTKEIGIEFAAMDVTLHPLLNFRGGIIMNPIGGFNQNHDGPKWEFVERPDMANNLLPATWSNAGFGMFGKTYKGDWTFGYETYVSNGFDNHIIDNEEGKTYLPATKENAERFEENNSGSPLVSGKVAVKNDKFGELGVSYMGGIYNKYQADGVNLDQSRSVHVTAVDYNKTIAATGTKVILETASINVDVPDTYTQQYGNRQYGMFIDVVQPIFSAKVLEWENAQLNLAFRYDYVDWNVGEFHETETKIGEELQAVTPALSFRPSGQTVFRLNYRYQWSYDVLRNPAARKAAWLFGFSTYF